MKCPHCGKEINISPARPDNSRMLKKYPFYIINGYIAYESEKAIKVEQDDLEIDDFFPKSQIRVGEKLDKADDCADSITTVWLTEWITESKGLESVLPRFHDEDDPDVLLKEVADTPVEDKFQKGPAGGDDIPF